VSLRIIVPYGCAAPRPVYFTRTPHSVPHPAPEFRHDLTSPTHDLIRGGAGRPGRRHSSGRFVAGETAARNAVPRGPAPGIHIAKRNDPPPPCSRVRVPPLPSAVPRRPALPRAPAPARRPPGPQRVARSTYTARRAGYNEHRRCQKMDKTTTRSRCGETLHQPPMHTHSIWTMRPDPCVLLL